MQCPFDSTTLTAIRRHDVEIEWCPSCKGVWLERGELDKIIERAAKEEASYRDERPRDRDRDDRDKYDRDRYERDKYERDKYDRDRYEYDKRKRKTSWLSEIFD